MGYRVWLNRKLSDFKLMESLPEYNDDVKYETAELARFDE
jgi:hypothetical protein